MSFFWDSEKSFTSSGTGRSSSGGLPLYAAGLNGAGRIDMDGNGVSLEDAKGDAEELGLGSVFLFSPTIATLIWWRKEIANTPRTIKATAKKMFFFIGNVN